MAAAYAAATVQRRRKRVRMVALGGFGGGRGFRVFSGDAAGCQDVCFGTWLAVCCCQQDSRVSVEVRGCTTI